MNRITKAIVPRIVEFYREMDAQPIRGLYYYQPYERGPNCCGSVALYLQSHPLEVPVKGATGMGLLEKVNLWFSNWSARAGFIGGFDSEMYSPVSKQKIADSIQMVHVGCQYTLLIPYRNRKCNPLVLASQIKAYQLWYDVGFEVAEAVGLRIVKPSKPSPSGQ
jgi:hypothetical protein